MGKWLSGIFIVRESESVDKYIGSLALWWEVMWVVGWKFIDGGDWSLII